MVAGRGIRILPTRNYNQGWTKDMKCGSRLYGTFSKRFLALPAFFLAAAGALTLPAQSNSRGPQVEFPNVLYGAAYYNEYMPQDTPTAKNERLAKDVALMKSAGLNVVRMGESTWSLWEPE